MARQKPMTTEFDDLIVELINVKLVVKGITKTELARRTGIDTLKIYNELNGRVLLSDEVKARIYYVLGITTADVLRYQEFKNYGDSQYK